MEKKAGLWRGEHEKGTPKPTRCKDCRSTDLEYDLAGQDDEQDGEIADAWQAAWEDGEPLGRLDADHEWESDWDTRFHFIRCYAECLDCTNWSKEYGPRYFYNPENNEYDLPAPLMPAEARIAERDAIRQAKIDAGQLTLFGE